MQKRVIAFGKVFLICIFRAVLVSVLYTRSAFASGDIPCRITVTVALY